MSAFHQLEQKLKLLKLGGMLTTIEQRIHQAEDGHLGYLDFLELLLEDEIERRSDHHSESPNRPRSLRPGADL